jgi:multiple antibiotic resistance protein
MSDAAFTPAFVATVLGLFAMMNPIGNTAIFLGMTDGLPAGFRARAALKTSLAVLVILELSIFGATAVLTAFGISMNAFEAAGGIIVLGIGLKMLHGSENPAHTTATGTAAVQATAQAEEEVGGKLVVPLAMPILAGPGSITTVVTVVAGHPGIGGKLGAAAGAALITLSLLACFLASGFIAKLLSRQAQEILLRFMGMILAAIAVTMILNGTMGSVSAYLAEHPATTAPG